MPQIGSLYLLATFAAALGVYWLLPGRWRVWFLAAVSIAYAAVLSPRNAAALVGWSAAFYFLSPLAAASAARPARRWVLWLLIGGILAYLAYFKYLVPSVRRLQSAEVAAGLSPYLIPAGVSYFTFKFIHYAVEVARGRIISRSPSQFLCYIFLFPIFTAGPIERFDHFLAHQQPRWQLDLLVRGLSRVVHGLIKKFVLAEMLLGPTFQFANSPSLMANFDALSPFTLWGMGVVTYLYVYLDFSAYTDLAIGASELFGIGIMENFDWPVLATNIGAFWKRWHMTLTGWCQTYIYMPVVGLTRRPNLATYAAFVGIGLWHAASWPWLFWGAYHATGVVAYGTWTRARRKRKKPLAPVPVRWAMAFAGVVATTLFVSFGELITFGGLHSRHDTLRVAAKLLFVRVR